MDEMSVNGRKLVENISGEMQKRITKSTIQHNLIIIIPDRFPQGGACQALNMRKLVVVAATSAAASPSSSMMSLVLPDLVLGQLLLQL